MTTLEECLALRNSIKAALDGGQDEFDYEIEGRKLRILIMQKAKAKWHTTGKNSLVWTDEEDVCRIFVN